MDFIRLAVLALCEFHVALARCEDLRAPGEPNSHTPRSKASRKMTAHRLFEIRNCLVP